MRSFRFLNVGNWLKCSSNTTEPKLTNLWAEVSLGSKLWMQNPPRTHPRPGTSFGNGVFSSLPCQGSPAWALQEEEEAQAVTWRQPQGKERLGTDRNTISGKTAFTRDDHKTNETDSSTSKQNFSLGIGILVFEAVPPLSLPLPHTVRDSPQPQRKPHGVTITDCNTILATSKASSHLVKHFRN